MSTAVQSVQAERYTVCITSYKEIFLWPTIIEGRGTSSLSGNVRTTFGMLPTSGVNMCACLEKDNYFPITKKFLRTETKRRVAYCLTLTHTPDSIYNLLLAF